MDCDKANALAALRMVCPRCGAAETDDLEVLDQDEMHALRCAACEQRFHLMIVECPGCGEENTLTWASVPTPGQINDARCVRCGGRLMNDGNETRPVDKLP
jgi:transcription elongation factor Elf1